MGGNKHRTQISLETWQYEALMESITKNREKPGRHHEGFDYRKIRGRQNGQRE